MFDTYAAVCNISRLRAETSSCSEPFDALHELSDVMFEIYAAVCNIRRLRTEVSSCSEPFDALRQLQFPAIFVFTEMRKSPRDNNMWKELSRMWSRSLSTM
jgi:hypothetical protein